MKIVKINTLFITLGQFLKLVGLINNGSEAKLFILENDIFVDSEKENRRGRKIYKNMVVQINYEQYQVILEEQNEH